MATNTLGLNQTFSIYNADGTPFHNLVLKKSTFESVVMSLGDKITGDVYYKDNTLAVTMSEYIEVRQKPSDQNEIPVKFKLVNPPTIVREGMANDNSEMRGMTKYSFTFYHPMYMLANFPFADVVSRSGEDAYLSQNKTFSWIGNLSDFISKINNNLIGTEWACEVGNTVPQEELYKISNVLSFKDQSIADALKTAYEEWEVPYVVDKVLSIDPRYSSGKRFVVRFGLPSKEILDNNGDPYVFKFGQGVGLKNNSRSPRNNKIITRIAGYGSSDNIPFGYPQIVWQGNPTQKYTGDGYPIYEGIVDGVRTPLIKHPFTRTHLMPSVYFDTVNKKVNPYAVGYNPSIEIKDYYDADGTYENPIVQSEPSYEIHEFEKIKPELTSKSISAISAYDEKYEGAISKENALVQLMNYYSESDNETERAQISIMYNHLSGTPSSEHHKESNASYKYEWSFENDDVYTFIKYASSGINFSILVLRSQYAPAPEWDDSLDDEGNCVQSYFKLILPSLGFDLYACAAITQEMSINMRSGACIGCTFPVMVDWDDYKRNFYDQDGNFDPVIGDGHPRSSVKYPDSTNMSIPVIVQKDNSTFGTILPNVFQSPQAGDRFVILGISLPQSYIRNAEQRLDADMKQYMRDNNVYYYDFPLKFDEYFLRKNPNILAQMKNNVIVRFEYVGQTLALYIKQMTIRYGQSPLPQYDITLTDDVEIVLNQIGKVTDDVSKLRVLMEQGNGVDLDVLDGRYLSKNNDDIESGFIRFIKGLQIGQYFTTGLLGEGGVFRREADGKTYLEVDKLYVRMKAYFDTVEIRKFMHSQGNRIASSAGIKCCRVEYIDVNGGKTQSLIDTVKFRCFFRNDDNGNTITNDFVVGDLAFCKETNAKVGQGVSQHGYWRKVVGVNPSDYKKNQEGYIELSNISGEYQEGSDEPLAQDDIVQLGNVSDRTRQGAIVEYVNGSDAPSYQIFQNINTFSLNGKNYISLGYSSTTGRAYMNVYGDMYVGDREETTYIKYGQVEDPETHQMRPKVSIKAELEIGTTIGGTPIDEYIEENTWTEEEINALIHGITDDIQSQIDGSIETWFYDYMPINPDAPTQQGRQEPLLWLDENHTIPCLPYKNWYDTDTLAGNNNERLKHLGDIFYDNSSGRAFRFANTGTSQAPHFAWVEIDDSAVIKALEDAAKAQDTADHKRRVFLQQPVPPYDAGDLWVNATYPANNTETDDTNHLYYNDLLKCITAKTSTGQFSINDWTLASKYTDDSALEEFVEGYMQDIDDILGQIDKKAETWYQNTNPEEQWYDPTQNPPLDVRKDHVSDLWYCTADITDKWGKSFGKDTTWYYKDFGVGANPRYAWVEQSVPKEFFDIVDGKASIYVNNPSNPPTNYKKNDLWILPVDATINGVNYKSGDILTATQDSTTYSATHWVKLVRYTGDEKINSYINAILNGGSTGLDANEAIIAAAQRAVIGALGATTVVDGGLLLTSLIGMRKYNGGDKTSVHSYTTWGGISGQYDNTTLGGGIAAWFGGGNVDYDLLSDSEIDRGWDSLRWAKSLFRFDGSGYVANHNIAWNAAGDITIKGVATLDAQNITINGGDAASKLWVQANFVSKSFFESLFKLYNNNTQIATNGDLPQDQTLLNIKAMFDFWSEKTIAALGRNTSSSGGGGATTLANLTDVELSAPSDGQVLKYYNGKWINGSGGGNITSIALSMPTGFSVSGSPLTTSGTLAVGFASGYSLPTTEKQTEWDTAYGWGNHAIAGYLTENSGDSRYLRLIGGTLSGGLAIKHDNGLAIWDTAQTHDMVFFWDSHIFQMYAYENSVLYDICLGVHSDSVTNGGLYFDASALKWGIGTASPSYTLHVNGYTYATRFYLANGVYLEYDSANSGVKLVGAGFYTESYVSALGTSSISAGSPTTLAELVDVDLSSPTNGQALLYNGTTRKWYNGSVQSSGGTITSIVAGTGLSGGTITSSGTIAINSTYQGYITHGETAYGWGNHATAGYVTLASNQTISGVKTFTNQQTFTGGIKLGSDNDVIVATTRLELGSRDNEIIVSSSGASASTMYVNYHSSGASKSIPTEWNWMAGTSTSYANFILGALEAKTSVRIGDAVLEWDSSNSALHLKHATTGSVAHFYADGGVAALGRASVASGGGATTLSDLTDVQLSSLSNGQVLTYSSSQGKWINSTGGITQSDLTTYLSAVSQNILPVDSSRNLGSANKTWRKLYVMDIASYGEFNIGSTQTDGTINADDLVVNATTFKWGNDNIATQTWAKQKHRIQKTGINQGWYQIATVQYYSTLLLSVGGGWSDSACTLASFYITHHNTDDYITQIGSSYLGFTTKIRLRRTANGTIGIDVYIASSTGSIFCAEIISLDSRPNITMTDFTSTFDGTEVTTLDIVGRNSELAAVVQNVVPNATQTYTIGTPLKRWSYVYARSVDISTGISNVGGMNITSDVGVDIYVTDSTDGEINLQSAHNIRISATDALSITAATFKWGGNTIATQTWVSGSYLPLDGTGTMTGKLTIKGSKGIEDESGNGLLVYKPSTWTGISSSQWGVGATDCQGVIRSDSSNLRHCRSTTLYDILDSYNTYISGNTITINGTSLTVSGGGGISQSDLVAYLNAVSQHILPSDSSRDLGSANKTWRKLYVMDIASYGEFNIGSTQTDGTINADDLVVNATTFKWGSSTVATRGWVNQQGFVSSTNGMSGLVMNNNTWIDWNNASGTAKHVISLNSSNQLFFGFGTSRENYDTYVDGHELYLRYKADSDSYPSTGIYLNKSGNVGIGTTSIGSYKLNVNGNFIANNFAIEYFSPASGVYAYKIGRDSYNIYQLGTWSTSSDVRKKDILRPVECDLETIARAPIFDFVWKNDAMRIVHVGTAAQYWRENMPNVTSIMDDGYLSMDYCAAALAAAIITARNVFTQKEEIESLKERVAFLEETIRLLS